jgi:hypothetical protein
MTNGSVHLQNNNESFLEAKMQELKQTIVDYNEQVVVHVLAFANQKSKNFLTDLSCIVSKVKNLKLE